MRCRRVAAEDVVATSGPWPCFAGRPHRSGSEPVLPWPPDLESIMAGDEVVGGSSNCSPMEVGGCVRI